MLVVPAFSSGAVSSHSQSSTGVPGTGFSTRLEAGASGNSIGAYNTDIAAMAQQNAQLLQLTRGGPGASALSTDLAEMSRQNHEMLALQMAMQRENIFFTSISNILKIKHDTLKTIISNIR
jgi:hypothetical protein